MTKNQFEGSDPSRKSTLLVAAFIVLLFTFFFFRDTFDKVAIALLLGLAYFTGIIAIFSGFIFSIFGVLTALPIISTIYAYIAFILAKIHYIIFRAFMNRTFKRMNWYRRLELSVKNNKLVKKVVKVIHSFLLGLGIDRSRRVKFFEVKKCDACKKDIPTDGRLCPYCGEKVN